MGNITNEMMKDIFSKEKTEDFTGFSLPVRWDGGDYYKSLYILLKEYRSSIDMNLKGTEYDEYRNDIKTVCRWVRLAVSESFQGNPNMAYEAVKNALDLLTNKYPCFMREYLIKDLALYRASDVKDKANHDRKRVFHVPFNLRSKMATLRYSISGYPSLYLGTSLELNCEEIDKDPLNKNVMAARFEYSFYGPYSHIMHQFRKPLYIIDLSVKPQDYYEANEEAPRLKTLKEICTNPAEDLLLNKPECYLLWYPLIAACSFIRAFRDDPYSAEYIIPQLVMQWIKKMNMPERGKNLGGDRLINNKMLGGVCYFSCVSNRASDMGLNYAFPSSGNDIWLFDEIKNYCPVLAANFALTEPVFVSEYESVKECEEALKEKAAKKLCDFSSRNIREKIRKDGGNYIIPDGEYLIPDYAFYGFTELKNITIPDSVTSIGDGAFDDCSGLKNIIIPDSVTSIGILAFEGCSGLTDIVIPDSVESISSSAFAGCTELSAVNVNSGNRTYYSKGNCVIERSTGKLVFGCKSTIIPDDGSVTGIGDSALYGCTGLTELTIPDSVTSIGDFAFTGCTGLAELTIPDSVTYISDFAFFGCKNLNLKVPVRFKGAEILYFGYCSSVSYY